MASTGLSYNPFLWNVQDNPYPCCRRLREQAPVYHVAERGLWVVTRLGDYELLLERAERIRNPNLRGYQVLLIRF